MLLQLTTLTSPILSFLFPRSWSLPFSAAKRARKEGSKIPILEAKRFQQKFFHAFDVRRKERQEGPKEEVHEDGCRDHLGGFVADWVGSRLSLMFVLSVVTIVKFCIWECCMLICHLDDKNNNVMLDSSAASDFTNCARVDYYIILLL